MHHNPRLPTASDFPAGTEFVICDFDVPLVFFPHEGWFNWFGGVPRTFDTSGLKPGDNRAARSFDEWVAIVEGSLKT